MNYKKIAYKSRYLSQDYQPFCEYCYFVKDKVVRAIDIDHIDWRWWKHNTDNRLLDPYNLIILCRNCHSKKTRKTKEYSHKITRYILDTEFYKRSQNFEKINKSDYLKY